eukprot:CAMPEP_0115313568 /NCGR_PEP_ID=MMETSP0270-20121206/76544_1 /TAXON_ID=71861 /ORGANISM="Scrippsiella trochoidea, Strain CCMP3099" /LENGTH=43 /DNA_ID= /DNA_START= /DNA_END= /DNA_ORIENTATION=
MPVPAAAAAVARSTQHAKPVGLSVALCFSAGHQAAAAAAAAAA